MAIQSGQTAHGHGRGHSQFQGRGRRIRDRGLQPYRGFRLHKLKGFIRPPINEKGVGHIPILNCPHPPKHPKNQHFLPG